MIRTFLAHVLAGLIFLACLGFLAELLGPTMAGLVSAAALIGALLRPGFDRYREAMRDRRTREVMNRNRERIGLAPIGRVSRRRGFRPTAGGYSAELSFPDRPIVPTRDAHFGE